MERICSKDGGEMFLDVVQICKSEQTVRLWFRCPKCHSGVTEVITYKTEPSIIVNEV